MRTIEIDTTKDIRSQLASDKVEFVVIKNINARVAQCLLDHQVDYNRNLDVRKVKVDRFFASSKLCNNCGYKKTDLKLSDRVWTCPDCGEVVDRDVNAAKNILEEGLRILKEQETEK